jgi:hypothetical protein
MKHKQPIVATELKLGDRGEFAVGANGELNASSKKDLIANQLKFLAAASNGNVVTASDAQRRQELTRKRRLAVEAAFNDKQAHVELGEVLAQNLYQAMNRKGFTRKYMARQDLQQGNIPRVWMRAKDVTAVWATSPTRLSSQITRDKLFTPPEFQIEARPFIPMNDINQSSGDVLEEKYMEAMEGIMVGEDRVWRRAAEATVGLSNQLTLIAGQLTPALLMEVRQNVARWSLQVAGVLMASDLYVDIVGEANFIQAIEPVARHELIMTGELAVLYGMTITSDAYRHPEHKVLNQGEFYCISDPVTHGQYTDRGGIETQPTDGVTEGTAGKGWWMFESFSLVVANDRSVAKGIRV